jgi:spore germination protein KB
MERTPVWVIGLVVFGVGLYGAHLGSDTLARIAPIFLGLQVSYFVFGWLMLGFSDTWDYSYLLPLLPVGILPTAEAAVVSTFWFASSALVVLALGADCSEEVRITGVVVRAHLISGLIALIWLVVILSMMGPIQAEFEGSPLYALSKVVFIRGILERADLLLYSSWVMGVSLEVGTYLLASILILSDVLGVGPRQVWVFCAVLSLGAAIPTVPGLFRLAAVFTPQPIGGVLVVLHVGLVGGTLLVSRIRSVGGLTDETAISRD